ncbi:Hypothetical protein R9X50_00741500 [Acrodontium crateriforme]|uniref:Vegetative cell wall protein gp1 n=1 Tax=Acrodontium crateriforme TaxID=150365 RepID=A0AAQ3MCD6_9PEZI|nr:Hypothetical protein R9X50_00741500 [Acrodontium crateriforme]
MFQTAGYAVHPPYFSSPSYNYKTPPPQTPPPRPSSYDFYSPRQYSYTATPAQKGHTRRATGDPNTFAYTTTYATPRKPAPYTTEYSSPGYYASANTTPQRKPDYVSGSDRKRESARQYRVFTDGEGIKEHGRYSSDPHYSSRPPHVFHDFRDRDFEYLPRYEQYEPRPPPYKRYQSYYESRADHRYYDQVPIYTSNEAEERPRPQRRASYTSKPTQPTQPRTRPSTATKSPPKATAEDAHRAGIPAGYSYKNWDPTEEPILLLGSVFDANSLGKWIYDWTVFYYGPATPISEVAGELWLLLIQLAGKIKRAEDIMPRIRQTASRDMVDDFLESGERLWQRFNKLLKICESYMWQAAKRESKGAANVTMGKNSGCEFVDAVFGRDRELERTEKLMTGMRLWSMRFDANCDEILRNPGA